MTLATASIAAITSSIADNLDQAVKTDSDVTFGTVSSGDITSTGTITAVEVHTTFVSSSIAVISGSNIFGDAKSDLHQFTGSVDVSGSFTLRAGDMVVSDTLTATNIGAFTAAGAIDFGDQNMTNVDIDSGDITGVTFGTAASTTISGSTTAVSSSIATRFDSRETDMTLATASIAAITASIGGIVGGTALLISGSATSTGSFGNIRAGGALPFIVVDAEDATAAKRGFQIAASGTVYAEFVHLYNDGEIRIGSPAGGGNFITFYEDGNERMRIDSTGKVGIGETAPLFPLHISAADQDFGTQLLLDTANNDMGCIVAGSAKGHTHAFIGNFKYNFDTPAASLNLYTNAGEGIQMDGATGIRFYATPNATVDASFQPAERMTILAESGNVGIGTANPIRALGVSYGAAKTSTSTAYAMSIQSNESANQAALQFYAVGGASAAVRKFQVQTTEVGVANSGIIEFQPDGGDVRFPNGILFGSDTAAANELDDYEEGTHTTAITGTSSGTWALHSDHTKLAYTKIGRQVTITGKYETSSGSGSGQLKISLPFTVANLEKSSGIAVGSITVNRVGSGNNITTQMTAIIFEDNAFINIQLHNENAAASETYLQADDIDAEFEGQISITYMTA